MRLIKIAAAAYLLLHAAAIALFTIIEPLYNDIAANGYDEVWLYLDPMTGAGIIIGIIFAALAKREAGRNAAAPDRAPGRNAPAPDRPLYPRLIADARLYGFLFVALLFYRNLFSDITGHGAHPQSADLQWAITYALYPLLAVSQALSLWREPRPK